MKQDRKHTRRLSIEGLEDRRMFAGLAGGGVAVDLAAPVMLETDCVAGLDKDQVEVGGFTNPANQLDVNADNQVTPLDALAVINDLNRNGARQLPAMPTTGVPQLFVDVNGDGQVTPVDVLQEINHLNQLSDLAGASGDLASAATALDSLNLESCSVRMTDAQKENVAKLAHDIRAIHQDSDMTPEQRRELTRQLIVDVIALAKAENKLPDAEDVKTLANAISTINDDEFDPKSNADDRQALIDLKYAIDAVFGSMDSTDELQAIWGDLQEIADAANLTKEDIRLIVGDLQAIRQEFKASSPCLDPLWEAVKTQLIDAVADDLHPVWDVLSPYASETQQQNVDELFADLDTVKQGVMSVDAALYEDLKADVNLLIENSTLPTSESVMALVEAWGALFDDDGNIIRLNVTAFVDALEKVKQEAEIPEEYVDAVREDIDEIVEASGLKIEDLQAVANDLRAVRQEFHANASVRREALVDAVLAVYEDSVV